MERRIEGFFLKKEVMFRLQNLTDSERVFESFSYKENCGKSLKENSIDILTFLHVLFQVHQVYSTAKPAPSIRSVRSAQHRRIVFRT